MKISFQGELGSYSHQACSEAFPNAVPLPCSTFEMAMDQVKEGKAQYTIIPVENSTYGRVADAYYLLPNSGLFIIKEHFLRVHINLLALPGVSLSEVKTAMSHTVLLGQCRKFLSKNNIKPLSGIDTAGSAKIVSESSDRSQSALASPLAGKIYGLDALGVEIEDMKNKYQDGIGWGDAKNIVFNDLNDLIKPIRDRYLELESNKSDTEEILQTNAKEVRNHTQPLIKEVKELVGIKKL